MLNGKNLTIKNFVITLISFVLLTSFTSLSKKEKTTNYTTEITVINKTKDFNVPFLQKDFIGFKEALAFKESQGKYRTINTLGYLGKYQFGKETLKRFRVYNTKEFLRNPELQEKAFIAYCKLNKWILRRDIKRSVGKTIKGIKITESGILAAAHLSGAGNVKKFLRSNGQHTFNDAYGTSIESYLKKFGGYDVSNIVATKKPMV